MKKKFSHWPQHIGSIWAALLSNHSLNPLGTIIEVGPGFTDKIGYGLAKLKFQGNFYILEPNEEALEWVTNRYKKILPNATIIPVNSTLQDARSVLPKDIEAILMNHVLDDMILHAGLPFCERQGIFGQIRPGKTCPLQVKNTWNDLINDPKYLLQIKDEVKRDLCVFVENTQARIVGMSQYKSWFLHKHELGKADLIGNKLLREFVLHLGDMSFEDKNILRCYSQDPMDWLFLEGENTF